MYVADREYVPVSPPVTASIDSSGVVGGVGFCGTNWSSRDAIFSTVAACLEHFFPTGDVKFLYVDFKRGGLQCEVIPIGTFATLTIAGQEVTDMCVDAAHDDGEQMPGPPTMYN